MAYLRHFKHVRPSAARPDTKDPNEGVESSRIATISPSQLTQRSVRKQNSENKILFFFFNPFFLSNIRPSVVPSKSHLHTARLCQKGTFSLISLVTPKPPKPKMNPPPRSSNQRRRPPKRAYPVGLDGYAPERDAIPDAPEALATSDDPAPPPPPTKPAVGFKPPSSATSVSRKSLMRSLVSNASHVPVPVAMPAAPTQHTVPIDPITHEADISRDPWDEEIGDVPWDEDLDEPAAATENIVTPDAQTQFGSTQPQNLQDPNHFENSVLEEHTPSENPVSRSPPDQPVPNHFNNNDWPNQESGPDPWDQEEDLDLEWDGHETTHVDEDTNIESNAIQGGTEAESLHTEIDHQGGDAQPLQGNDEPQTNEPQAQQFEELGWKSQNDFDPQQVNDPYSHQAHDLYEQQSGIYEEQTEAAFWKNDDDLFQNKATSADQSSIPPVFAEEIAFNDLHGNMNKVHLEQQHAPIADLREFDSLKSHKAGDENHDLNHYPAPDLSHDLAHMRNHFTYDQHDLQSEQLHPANHFHSEQYWNDPQSVESAPLQATGTVQDDGGFEEIINNFEKFNVHDNGQIPYQETPQNYEHQVHDQHLNSEPYNQQQEEFHQDKEQHHMKHEQFDQDAEQHLDEPQSAQFQEATQNEQKQHPDRQQKEFQDEVGYHDDLQQNYDEGRKYDRGYTHVDSIHLEHNSQQVDEEFWQEKIVTHDAHLLHETMSRKYTLDTELHEETQEGGLNIDYENEKLNFHAQELNETVIHFTNGPAKGAQFQEHPVAQKEETNEATVKDTHADLQLLDLDSDFLLDDEFLDEDFLEDSAPIEPAAHTASNSAVPAINRTVKKLYLPLDPQPQMATTELSYVPHNYAPQPYNLSTVNPTYAPNKYAPVSPIVPTLNHFAAPQQSITESLELKKLEVEKKKNDAYDFPDEFMKPVKPVTRMKLIPQIHNHETGFASPPVHANTHVAPQAPPNAPPSKNTEHKPQFFGDLVGPKAPPAKRPAPVKVMEPPKPVEMPTVPQVAPKQPHNPYASLPSRAQALTSLPNPYQPVLAPGAPPMNAGQGPAAPGFSSVSNPYTPSLNPNMPMVNQQMQIGNPHIPIGNPHILMGNPHVPIVPSAGPPGAMKPSNYSSKTSSVASPKALNKQAFVQPQHIAGQHGNQYAPAGQPLLSPSTNLGRFQPSASQLGSHPVRGNQVPFPSVQNAPNSGRVPERKTSSEPYIPRAGPYGPQSHSRKSSMMTGGKVYTQHTDDAPHSNAPPGALANRRSTFERMHPGQKQPETFRVDPNTRLVKQIPVFTWGATDMVVAAVPHMNQLHGYSTGIRINKISELTTKFDSYNDFPGPLSKSKTKKKDLEQWLARHNERLRSSGTNQDEILIAEILLVLLQQDGAFLAPPTQRALAAVLAPHVDFTPENSGFVNNAQAHAPNAFRLDATGLNVVWNLIQSGNSKAALDFALSKEDWALAIIIAQSLGQAVFMTVCSDFARRMFPVQQAHGTKAHHMMPILMKLFVGNVKGVIDDFVKFQLEGDFAQKFYRDILAAAIVNGTTLEFLVEFGKYLKDNMMQCASEICFMIAGIVPSRTPLANGTIFATVGTMTLTSVYTEIYEYIVASSSVTPSAMLANVFTHTLPIKIQRAQELADLGNFAAARRYCDFIGSTLRALGKTPIVPQQAADEFQRLVVRLSEYSSGDNSWLGSTLTKVNLDGMWGTIDKLIGGEPTSTKPEKGVFSNFSPSISRNASQLDISQIPVPGQRPEMQTPQNFNSSAASSSVSSPQHRFNQTNRYGPVISSGGLLQNVSQPPADPMNRAGVTNVRPNHLGKLASGMDVTVPIADPGKPSYRPKQSSHLAQGISSTGASGDVNNSLPIPPSGRANIASRSSKNARMNTSNLLGDSQDPLAQSLRTQQQFKRDSVGSNLSTGSAHRTMIRGHSRVSSLQSETHAQLITKRHDELKIDMLPENSTQLASTQVIPKAISQSIPKIEQDVHESSQQSLQHTIQGISQQSVLLGFQQSTTQGGQHNINQQSSTLLSETTVSDVTQDSALKDVPPTGSAPHTNSIPRAQDITELSAEKTADIVKEEAKSIENPSEQLPVVPPTKPGDHVTAPPASRANKPVASNSDYPDLLPTRRKPARAPYASSKGNPYAPPDAGASSHLDAKTSTRSQMNAAEKSLLESSTLNIDADSKTVGSVTESQIEPTVRSKADTECTPETPLQEPPLQTLVAPVLQSLENQEISDEIPATEVKEDNDSNNAEQMAPVKAPANPGARIPTKSYAPPAIRRAQPNPYGPPEASQPVLNQYAPRKATRSYVSENANVPEIGFTGPDKNRLAAANLDVSFDNGAEFDDESDNVAATRNPLLLNTSGNMPMPNAYLNPYNMGLKGGRANSALDDFPIPQTPDYTSRANSIIGQLGLYSSKLSQHATYHQDYHVEDDVVPGYESAGEDDEDEVPVPVKKAEKEDKKPEKNLSTKKSIFKMFGGAEKDDGKPKATKANLGNESTFKYDEKLGRWIDTSKPLEEQLKQDEPPPPPMKKPMAGAPSLGPGGQVPSPGIPAAAPARDGSKVVLPPVSSSPSTLDDLIQAKAPKRRARRNYVNEMNKN